MKDFLHQRGEVYNDVPVLIKGKPGTGKSHALKVAIKETLEDKFTVCCTTVHNAYGNTDQLAI